MIKISKRGIDLFRWYFIFLSVSSLYGIPISQVTMIEEQVTIEIFATTRAKVKTDFIFHETMNYFGTLAFPETFWYRLENFSAKWNDHSLFVRRLPTTQDAPYEISGQFYSGMLIYNVPITERNISNHTVEYEFNLPFIDDTKFLGERGYYGEYILQTGAPWFGPIGKIRVSILLANCSNLKSVYNGYQGRCINKKTWYFEASDIEPNQDIRFLISE